MYLFGFQKHAQAKVIHPDIKQLLSYLDTHEITSCTGLALKP